MAIRMTLVWSLWSLFNPRINLSPFTKDFRGEGQYNESIDLFFSPYLLREYIQNYNWMKIVGTRFACCIFFCKKTTKKKQKGGGGKPL